MDGCMERKIKERIRSPVLFWIGGGGWGTTRTSVQVLPGRSQIGRARGGGGGVEGGKVTALEEFPQKLT